MPSFMANVTMAYFKRKISLYTDYQFSLPIDLLSAANFMYSISKEKVWKTKSHQYFKDILLDIPNITINNNWQASYFNNNFPDQTLPQCQFHHNLKAMGYKQAHIVQKLRCETIIINQSTKSMLNNIWD